MKINFSHTIVHDLSFLITNLLFKLRVVCHKLVYSSLELLKVNSEVEVDLVDVLGVLYEYLL